MDLPTESSIQAGAVATPSREAIEKAMWGVCVRVFVCVCVGVGGWVVGRVCGWVEVSASLGG